MTSLLRRALARVGLVPRRQFEQTKRALGEAQAQVRRLEKSADELTKNFAAAKSKAHDAVLRAKQAEHDVKRLEKQVAEREHEASTQTANVRQRLDAAERELALAREQLMLVEVKLDVLEGAANVLDLRTRNVGE